MKLLWAMRSPVFVRNFESVLRELDRRGHRVHVALEGDKEGVAGQHDLLRRLTAELDGLSTGSLPLPSGPRALAARRARSGIDYLRYLEPAYRDASALRRRAAKHAPPGLPRLERTLLRSPAARRRVAASLRAAERAAAPTEPARGFLAAQAPDLLLVSPLMHFGSPQPDYVRAARAAGIPSALALFSWDNLTNKTLMHEVPDRLLLWNEAQVAEARDLQGVDPGRCRVTGSPAYDHWFGWEPERDREAFCAAHGLDPSRPFLLYACSSSFIAPDEHVWVRDWLARVRREPALREVGVLVRPHPLNAAMWREVDLLDARAVVHPRGGADPTDTASRSAYHDAIHHAATVVGINTTALIESAILGRGTHTVRVPRYRGTQEGTLHFHHLRAENGGPLHVADDLDAHVAGLARAVEGAEDEAGRLSGFVERFIRPRGLDLPVAPAYADELEALA